VRQHIPFIGHPEATDQGATESPHLLNSVKSREKTMKIIYEDLPVIHGSGEILEDTTDWRTFKLKSTAVSHAMNYTDEVRSERILDCGSLLAFGVSNSGEKRLIKAYFCKDRMCPACQKRRSLVVFHQVKDVCLSLQSEYKSTRYLLLTLTVPNVSAADLSDEIKKMNKAWASLSRKVEFKKSIWGWFKALEITHNKKTNTYHPHFHVLLAVPAKYFKGQNYINHSRWLELWQMAMKNDYITQVDVRRVKPNPKRSGSTIEAAAAEVGKYATKPSDYIKKLSKDRYVADPTVVGELAEILKFKRLIAFGGRMKEHYQKLKFDDVDSDSIDLVNVSGESDQVDAVVLQMYKWNIGLKQYIS
jgi:plasmid rolling circle replication initiator protein Rep